MMSLRTQRRRRTWILPASLVLLLLLVLVWGSSCSGTTIPFLGHMKRPSAMAVVKVKSTNGVPSNLVFIANADLHRLTVVDAQVRSFLIDTDLTTPGILYLKTGLYPIDLAVSPDQKRLFVLNGIDGDLSVFSVENLLDPAKRKANPPKRIPANCKPQGNCWRGASRLLAVPQDGGSLRGVVAIGGEQRVAVIDLNADGKELKSFPVRGTPSGLIWSESEKAVYVTDSARSEVHRIDMTKLTMTSFEVSLQVEKDNNISTPTKGGSISTDGRFLYLLDLRLGGIRVYDTKDKKVVPPGETRFPDRPILQLESGTFLSARFVPALPLLIKDDKGQDKSIEKPLVWASASDGFVYLIDPETHKLLDSDERGPTAQNPRLFVGRDSIGDARQPIRKALPSVEASTETPSGITLFDGKTRTETWTMTYEGQIVTSRPGRFLDFSKGEFIDFGTIDLGETGARPGDVLVLEKACPSTGTNTDAGAGTEGGASDCVFPIVGVDRNRLKVDTAKARAPQGAQFSYTVRASKSYAVIGSVTGVVPERAVENKLYKNEFFSLTLKSGSAPTPVETRIEFSVSDGFVPARLRLGGLPSRSLLLANHPACTKEQCNTERCRSAPLCTDTKCEVNGSEEKRCGNNEDCNATTGVCVPRPKLWLLDPTESRLYIVGPQASFSLETTLQ